MFSALIVSLTLVGFGHAAQFRVTQTSLSSRRFNPTGVSWGDVSVFAGGSSTDHVDIFVNGSYVNTTNLYDGGDTLAAAAYPGVVAFAVRANLQFFDAVSQTLWPRNASDRLGAHPQNAVGAESASLIAFTLASSGTVELVNTAQRTVVLGTQLDTGRAGVASARVRDSIGVEYFVFMSGSSTSSGLVSSDASVLQVTAPGAFVSPQSQMAVARRFAVCATTSANKIVCLGGEDGSGAKLNDGESCTISTAGVLSCTALAVPLAVKPESTPIVALGPFIATRMRNSQFKYGIAVSDAALADLVVPATFDSISYWNDFGATSNGRFAYFAGGVTGVGVSTDVVTVIECLEPCAEPLVGSVSTTTAQTGGTIAATSGTTATTFRKGETATGASLQLPLLLAACLCVVHLI